MTFKQNTDVLGGEECWCLVSAKQNGSRGKKKKKTVGEERQSQISIKDCACVHRFSLLMMIRINICTRGTDNGDMAFVSHLGGYGRCQLSAKKRPSPRGRGARFY